MKPTGVDHYLTTVDAAIRADLIEVLSYAVELDLTDGSGNPSWNTFRSKTKITFTVRRPGETSFVDVVADKIHMATLNGFDVEFSSYAPDKGIRIENLAAENILFIDADLQYTNSGKGLHKFVDPIDGQTYLYSQFHKADAKRMYACFDQPDLKATFTIRAKVPNHWEVASNGREKHVERLAESKTIYFETTERISPYATSLMAGPYHVVRTQHDGIDLGLWCRKTLSPHLDAEELLKITTQGLDWYRANFGARYAFDKYDQLFVPEFHTDAMENASWENASCVTFRERFIFKSKVPDDLYARRAYTILREMAHMWFGNLVMLRWWENSWLNGSFATYAAALCMENATRWTEAWLVFVDTVKNRVSGQNQLPPKHPAPADALDVQTAEINFDVIRYAEGASVLRQLSAYVGREAFLVAIREYFVAHAPGNTTLTDLLRALEHSSGRSLNRWSVQGVARNDRDQWVEPEVHP